MKRAPKHRGVALILVVVMIAAAAIMSFALLSSASMQSEATHNSVSCTSADGLAQSGANLAAYYLMYPDKAPASALGSSNGITYYNPGTNIPSMSLSDGTSIKKISVALSSRAGTLNTYGVDVTATAGSTASPLTRTLHSDLLVQELWTPKYAMSSNDSFTIPLSGVSVSINGNARCDGGLGGLLTAILGSTIIPSNASVPSYPSKAVPAYSQLNVVKNLPAYSGGTAQLIGSSISGTAGFPAVAGTNPDSVFYTNGSLTLAGTINLTGTIVVPSGSNLIINSNAVTITTKKTGQPALIVGGNLIFNGAILLSTRSLTVNGLTWLGGNMMAQGGILPTSQLTVNGALMWGGSNPKIDTSSILGASYVHVNWPTTGGQLKDAPNWDLLYVPNLTDDGQTPRNVKVVSTSIH